MKILFIAPLESIHSVRWINYFIKKGHDVHILSFTDQLCNLDAVSITIMKPNRNKRSRFEYYISYLKSLRRIVDSIKPDIIHIHWIDKLPFIAVINKPYPVIVTAWGSDVLINPKNSYLSKFFLKRLLFRAQLITTDGIHLKSALSTFGIPENKIKIINFGTNLNEFNPFKRVKHFSSELGYQSDIKFLVISIRSLNPLYDVSTFIRAIPLVIKLFSQVGFIVVGDGKEKNSLELLSKKLGVNGSVRFVGRLSDSQLQRFLASSDIYVSTSLSDAGLASSTSEAMASGLPVIVTDFGDNGRWIKELETGMLFPCSDHKTLSDKIIFLANDRKTAARIANSGRQLIQEKNDYHAEMEKVDRLYRDILASES